MRKIVLLFFILLQTSCSSSKLSLSRDYISNGDYGSAKIILEQALYDTNEPKFEVYYLLGYVEGELYNIEKMVDYFSQSLSINSYYAKNIEESKNYWYAIHFNKGVEHYNTAEFNLAEHHFLLAQKCKPYDKEVRKNLSYIESMKTGNSERNFYTTRYRDVETSPEIRDNFGPGEIPTVVMQNYEGETVTVEINKLGTGELILKEVQYIPQKHKLRFFQLNKILNGSYKATLSISGLIVDTHLFSVSR